MPHKNQNRLKQRGSIAKNILIVFLILFGVGGGCLAGFAGSAIVMSERTTSVLRTINDQQQQRIVLLDNVVKAGEGVRTLRSEFNSWKPTELQKNKVAMAKSFDDFSKATAAYCAAEPVTAAVQLGDKGLSKLSIFNHPAYDNLVLLGTTSTAFSTNSRCGSYQAESDFTYLAILSLATSRSIDNLSTIVSNTEYDKQIASISEVVNQSFEKDKIDTVRKVFGDKPADWLTLAKSVLSNSLGAYAAKTQKDQLLYLAQLKQNEAQFSDATTQAMKDAINSFQKQQSKNLLNVTKQRYQAINSLSNGQLASHYDKNSWLADVTLAAIDAYADDHERACPTATNTKGLVDTLREGKYIDNSIDFKGMAYAALPGGGCFVKFNVAGKDYKFTKGTTSASDSNAPASKLPAGNFT